MVKNYHHLPNCTNTNENTRYHTNSFANIVDNSPEYHYDPQSNMHFNYLNNQQQNRKNRVPPPTTINLRMLDSPAQSPCRRMREQDDDEFITVGHNKKRKQLNKDFDDQFEDPQQKYNNPNAPIQQQTSIYNNNHNNDPPPLLATQSSRTITSRTISNSNLNPSQPKQQQQNKITPESARFAQTRFPYQPFIIRFTSGNIKDKQVAHEISKHFKDNYHTDISILNIRRSIMKCQQNEYDYLIYVKDSITFSLLFHQQNWSQRIGGETFIFPSSPSFPAQLSFIIKNVDLRINLDDFAENLKATYPEIHAVIRLKNKFQNNIRLIKIEILSPTIREQILNAGNILVNSITYDVEEYLSPANVLICSKGMAIGHFKKQCTQINETCKVCGLSCPDLRHHNCSLVNKCVHCNGDHVSNSFKCPIVKNFRAELTKKLLFSNRMSSSYGSTNTNINNTYSYDATAFPVLPRPQQPSPYSITNNSMINKIDELISSVRKVNDTLEKFSKKNDEFELFMNNKIKNDEILSTKIDHLIENDVEFKKNIIQHEIKITRHENIFIKLILPMIDEISKYLSIINIDKKGGTLDADFQVTINRMRVQLENVTQNKNF
ncbi:unnamed protein product [Rotaria sordida]|uniref:Uncharacterized protein n=1 Tax=Rotaria sordida TaxID=392033 RepID=A0A815TUG0_9BILA|nr:unnamed protein product [Rotaria sordida]CAF1658706.1 unnamed protein product [Rotaria sordida]